MSPDGLRFMKTLKAIPSVSYITLGCQDNIINRILKTRHQAFSTPDFLFMLNPQHRKKTPAHFLYCICTQHLFVNFYLCSLLPPFVIKTHLLSHHNSSLHHFCLALSVPRYPVIRVTHSRYPIYPRQLSVWPI